MPAPRATGEAWGWVGLVLFLLAAGWALGVATCWVVIPRVVCSSQEVE